MAATLNDFINGAFEAIGAMVMWINVVKLKRDKQVRGIYWPLSIFWASWSVWNLYYYPTLKQWWSFTGGVVMVAGNLTWMLMAFYYCVLKRK